MKQLISKSQKWIGTHGSNMLDKPDGADLAVVEKGEEYIKWMKDSDLGKVI